MSGVDEDCVVDASQETIMPSQNMDFNLYNVPTENVFTPLGENVWVGSEVRDRQREKRRRNNTGSREFDSLQGIDLNGKIDLIISKLIHIEESQNQMSMNMNMLQERVKRSTLHVDANTFKIQQLTYKALELDVKQRQNNLLIYGIEESRHGDVRDLREKVNSFFDEHLCIEQVDIYIQDVYRLGSNGSIGQHKRRRPVMCALGHSSQVDLVMRNARQLKGTQYSIDRDYPHEIVVARKQLWPEVKEMRRAEPRANIQLKYPARIEKNGIIVKDAFPYWKQMLNLPAAADFKYLNTESSGQNANSVQINQTDRHAYVEQQGNWRRPTVHQVHVHTQELQSTRPENTQNMGTNVNSENRPVRPPARVEHTDNDLRLNPVDLSIVSSQSLLSATVVQPVRNESSQVPNTHVQTVVNANSNKETPCDRSRDTGNSAMTDKNSTGTENPVSGGQSRDQTAVNIPRDLSGGNRRGRSVQRTRGGQSRSMSVRSNRR